MTEKIRVSIEGPVGRITLNRPEKLNAIDPDMLDGLEAAARRLDGLKEVRVVILESAGDRAFCVGADIKAWAALDPMDMWRQWIRDGHRVFDQIEAMRQPVLAKVDGLALGGGLEFALAADIRIAAADAEFALPEVTIGTVPGWGGTSRLPDAIGRARARQMIYTGERISSKRALEWGLVNEAIDPVDLDSRVTALATAIAGNAGVAVQLAKQATRAERSGDVVESIAGALAGLSPDGKEGTKSFLDKRSPRFNRE